MKKHFGIMLIALIGLAVSVAYASVQTDYDRSVNFATYHTYSWGEIKTNGDSLWSDRLRHDVDQQLAAKGWTLATSDADVVILALLASHTKEEETTFYSGYGGGYRWGGGMATATTSSYTSKHGELVISMFDAKSKKIVWRATETRGISDNPSKNIGKLTDAVGDIFKKFPPKP